MKKVVFLLILALALMEGVVWIVLKSSKEEAISVPQATDDQTVKTKSMAEEKPEQTEATAEGTVAPSFSSATPVSGLEASDFGSFPLPTTEVVNGVTERTIHMGVRQYEWQNSSIATTAISGRRSPIPG